MYRPLPNPPLLNGSAKLLLMASAEVAIPGHGETAPAGRIPRIAGDGRALVRVGRLCHVLGDDTAAQGKIGKNILERSLADANGVGKEKETCKIQATRRVVTASTTGKPREEIASPRQAKSGLRQPVHCGH